MVVIMCHPQPFDSLRVLVGNSCLENPQCRDWRTFPRLARPEQGGYIESEPFEALQLKEAGNRWSRWVWQVGRLSFGLVV